MKKVIIEAISKASKTKETKRKQKQNLYFHAGMIMTLEEVRSYNLANTNER